MGSAAWKNFYLFDLVEIIFKLVNTVIEWINKLHELES